MNLQKKKNHSIHVDSIKRQIAYAYEYNYDYIEISEIFMFNV